MDSATINLLGYVAGTLTTISFLPQVVKSWKSRSAKDISLGMFVILALGIMCWLVYGILTRALPVIIANGVTFCLICFIIYLKMRYR